MQRDVVRLLVRAWLTIAVVDAIFATMLPVVAYGQPLGRVWQGVASVLLGPSAMQGGTRTMIIGLVMHLGVALAWSTLFLTLALLLPRLRQVIVTSGGIVAVSALYGPAIWMIMSFVVIPRLTGRPPTVNARWGVQLFAHIPFVAIPIVATIGRGLRASSAVAGVRPAEGVA